MPCYKSCPDRDVLFTIWAEWRCADDLPSALSQPDQNSRLVAGDDDTTLDRVCHLRDDRLAL
ncbi:hypothetical protein WOLCODRAFT_26484 [Wolfiporia cocos MD-104 SS10]|uniref:Uncharacterized protein n=1 Tax=Wolfiporia cocos (strain MD-104) TaxID=742152 RepID=A0A2H3JPF9_WOLCO|nr:hypothetical protein WOLCODRAFT_26484 [Wolfiporia cocos MD-104 SS10]